MLEKFILIVTILCLFGTVNAESYPNPDKPITIVVNTAAGGTLDIVARWLAKKLIVLTKGNYLVVNKPGANGNIAMMHVKNSDPDGYTLYLMNPNHITNSIANPQVQYHPYHDFTVIGPIITSPMILMTTENSKVKSMSDLKNTKPNQYTYTASQIGSGPHLGVMALEKALDVEFLYVPYKGAGNSYTDFLNGTVDFAMYIYPSAMTVIQNSKVKPIAISTTSRLTSIPNVPTFNELGIKGLEINTFYGIVGPKNIPPHIVGYLNKTLNTIITDKTNIAELNALGLFPAHMTPNETISFLKSQEIKLKPLLEKITANTVK